MTKPIKPGCLAMLIRGQPQDIGKIFEVINLITPEFDLQIENSPVWKIDTTITWVSTHGNYKKMALAQECDIKRLDDFDDSDYDFINGVIQDTKHPKQPLKQE